MDGHTECIFATQEPTPEELPHEDEVAPTESSSSGAVLQAPIKAVQGTTSMPLTTDSPLRNPRLNRPKSASVLKATRSDTSFGGGVSKYAASILGADSDDDEVCARWVGTVMRRI